MDSPRQRLLQSAPPRRVAVRAPSASTARADVRQRRREHIVFRRLLVGPVEAVSLAKPSKPADEEKFALLNCAGCSHRLHSLSPLLREGRGEGELAVQSASHRAAPISLPSQLKQLPDPSASESPPGNQLLIQAAAQLERRASVTAKLRHQVALGGQQLYGVGSYWQQGSGEELKVRLELQIAGQEAQLLQVCNSRYMWLDRRLPTGRM